MNKQQQAAYNKQTDFILDHPVSFASDLIYSIASDVEENLQQKINRNRYENIEGLNQAEIKLLFLSQVSQSSAQKLIYSSHERTATLLIYHHKNRLSPYLLLIIEFDYIPLESPMNGKARQSTSNKTNRKEIQSEKVKILEDIAYEIREKGYTFYSDSEKKEITLNSAICAVVRGIGNSIMYEIYDPTGL